MAIKVSGLSIKEEDELDFFYSISKALSSINASQQGTPYLLNYDKRSIVISFDSTYSPFLGFTHGFNPVNTRVMLVQCWLLTEIGELARVYNTSNNEQAGGRVFISRALIHIHDNIPLAFPHWNVRDPYDVCKELYDYYF